MICDFGSRKAMKINVNAHKNSTFEHRQRWATSTVQGRACSTSEQLWNGRLGLVNILNRSFAWLGKHTRDLLLTLHTLWKIWLWRTRFCLITWWLVRESTVMLCNCQKCPQLLYYPIQERKGWRRGRPCKNIYCCPRPWRRSMDWWFDNKIELNHFKRRHNGFTQMIPIDRKDVPRTTVKVIKEIQSQ